MFVESIDVSLYSTLFQSVTKFLQNLSVEITIPIKVFYIQMHKDPVQSPKNLNTCILEVLGKWNVIICWKYIFILRK